MPLVLQKLTKCCFQFAGHCQRPKGEIIQSLLLWKPSGPVHSRKMTSLDTILRDSRIDREDHANAMSDQNAWNKITVQSIAKERAD